MNVNGKRLTRSTSNAVLLGVCGGLAAYFQIDPTLVRVITVVVAVFTGFLPVVIAYALCVLIMPTDAAQLGQAAPPAVGDTPPESLDWPKGPGAA
jgi:phage shock protein C